MSRRVLVACEESQAVCIAFRARGFDAYSCDIQPCSGGHPEWHIQGDVLPLLKQGWHLVVAFPPCTHLACSGAKHFAQKRADGRQAAAVEFFMQFAGLKCAYAIENPVGVMSSKWRKPDQIVQPWQFGDRFQKTTCLWLNRLPLLVPTNVVEPGEFVVTPSGKKLPKWYSNNTDPVSRSRTFPGIAEAMAEQWGKWILGQNREFEQLELELR